MKQKKNFSMHEYQERRMKAQTVKDGQWIAYMKKQEYEWKKIEDAWNMFDKKIHDEESVIKQKEKEVMQMEMLEMELIKWLQNT